MCANHAVISEIIIPRFFFFFKLYNESTFHIYKADAVVAEMSAVTLKNECFQSFISAARLMMGCKPCGQLLKKSCPCLH